MLLSGTGRTHPASARGRGYLARSRARARGDRAAEHRRARTCPSARRAAPTCAASTRSCTSMRNATRESPRVSWAFSCCARSCRRRRGPAALVPADWNWHEKRDEYIRYAQRRALGPSTASLVKAAEERNIPWLRLNEQSLIQLGHGKYQQRIQATVTSRTSHIAVELAQDKEETNKILANCGLPVPRQELVRSADRAVRAAERLGYPGGHQALRRQSRPRDLDRAEERGGGARRLRRGGGAFQFSDRRDLSSGRGPPASGRRRRAHRRDPPHAGPRRRRRRFTPSASSSTSSIKTRGAASATRK